MGRLYDHASDHARVRVIVVFFNTYAFFRKTAPCVIIYANEHFADISPESKD